MGSYIDTDLIKTIVYPPVPKEEETDSEYFYRIGWQVGIGKVLKLPTADVRENVKGEWQVCDDPPPPTWWYECSICGSAGNKEYNFCPNCGADMRGEEE